MHWNVCNHTNTAAQSFVTFDSYVGNLHNSSQVGNTHFVVATGRFKRALHKQLIRTEYIRGQGCTDISIDTLDSLIRKTMRLAGLRLRMCTPEQRDYLIVKAISTADLQYFSFNDTVSTAATLRLMHIVAGLRRDGLTAAAMRNDAEAGIVDAKRYEDITAIVERYEELLLASGLHDYASLIVAITQLDSNVAKDLTKNRHIALAGFHEFTEPEIQFLEWLGASENEITLFLEGAQVNDGAFSHVREVTQRLTQQGWYVHSSEQRNSNVCTELHAALFSSSSNKVSRNPGCFQLYKALNPREEVQWITREIVELIRSGIDPAEICVLTRAPEVYSRLLSSACTAANIPFNSSERNTLSSSSLYADIKTVLALPLQGFRTEDLAMACQSPLGRIVLPETSAHVNEICLIAEKMRFNGGFAAGGLQAWNSIIDEACQENGKDVGEELQQFAQNFPRTSQPVQAWTQTLRGLLIESGALSSHVVAFFKTVRELYEHTPGLLSESELLAAAARSFEHVLNTISVYPNILESQDRMHFSEFVATLDMASRRARYNAKEVGEDGVLLTTTEQVRGIDYRIVFLCGMYEGAFPRSYQPEVFLGRELPETSVAFYDREKTDFIIALTNNEDAFAVGTKRVYLSYPMMLQSVETMESSFVRELHFRLPGGIRQADVSNIAAEILPHEFGELNTGIIASDNSEVLQRVNNILAGGISPSFMEQYAQCGYKTLLSRFLRLSEKTEYGLELESRERGLIVHQILDDFLTHVRNEQDQNNGQETSDRQQIQVLGLTPIQLNPEKRSEYLEIIQSITQTYTHSHKSHSAVNTLSIHTLGDGVRTGVLTRLVDQVFDQLFEGEWQVLATEFDLLAANDNTPVQVFDGIAVRGIVDRVDVRRREDTIEMRVVDYKTGKVEQYNQRSYLLGQRFQMTLYAAALEALATQQFGETVSVVSALYVSGAPNLSDSKRSVDIFDASGKYQKSELYEATQSHALAFVDDLKRGVFTLAEKTTYCQSCDFKTVCRVFDKNAIQQRPS